MPSTRPFNPTLRKDHPLASRSAGLRFFLPSHEVGSAIGEDIVGGIQVVGTNLATIKHGGWACDALDMGAYVTIPASLQLTLPITIACRIRILGAPTAYAYLFGGMYSFPVVDPNQSLPCFYYGSGGNFLLGANTSGAFTGTNSTVNYAGYVGRSVTLVATTTTTTLTLYLNGEVISSSAGAYVNPTYTGTSRITVGNAGLGGGAANRNANILFEGGAIWNSALTDKQIRTLTPDFFALVRPRRPERVVSIAFSGGVIQGVGTASGDSTASAVAMAIRHASGTAPGDSVASSGAVAIRSATGIASGDSTASASAIAIRTASGTAPGDSSASAVAIAISTASGLASADSTALAIARAIRSTTGTAPAEAFAVAIGEALGGVAGTVTGIASGDSTASASAIAIRNVSGTAPGDSSATGVASVVAHTTGTAPAEALAPGVGFGGVAGVVPATGVAPGEAFADAISEIIVSIPIDILDITALAPPFSLGGAGGVGVVLLRPTTGTASAGASALGVGVDLMGLVLTTGTAVGEAFAFGVRFVPAPPSRPVTYAGLLDMVPMPDSMYPDVVRIRRKVDVPSGGRLKHQHGMPGPEVPACVDARRVDRSDPSGRVTVFTIYTISTPDDPALNAEDMVVWVDHRGTSRNLLIEGPSVPQGQGDIEFIADAFQVV